MNELEIYTVLAGAALYAYMAMRFVPDGESWIVYRQGKPLKEVGPGMVFVWPFLDSFKVIKTTAQTLRFTQLELASDKQISTPAGAMVYRVTNGWSAYNRASDPENILFEIMQTEVASLCSEITVESHLRDTQVLENKAVAKTNEKARDLGLRVVAINLADIRAAHDLVMTCVNTCAMLIAITESLVQQTSSTTRSISANDETAINAGSTGADDYKFGI